MILIGHNLIASASFYHIDSIGAIANTPPNSIVSLIFSYTNIDIINHLAQNNITFALFVENPTEAVIAHNLGASYMIVAMKNAKEIQSIAEHYLFDAKVLALISEEKQLRDAIELRVDGAIYSEAIIKITS